jgi:ABC-type transport system substrate-binding protein
MVGTGFLQKEYRREVTLSGTRNNYWEAGKPYLDAVKYLFVADELTATALFKSGGGDVLQATNPTVLKELEASGNTVIPVALGPFTLMPDGANADSPWSNQKVREAVEYALDKEALARTFGYGFKAATQFSTPVSKAFDPAIKGRVYDLVKAKQLMADAGYPNGFKTQILASPIFLNRDAVVAVASYLSKIGIQAEMIFPGFAQWSDLSTKPWKNALIWTSINEWGNQNATFNYFLGAPAVINKSVFKPEGYQQLLDSSKATPEADPVLLKKIENVIFDTAMVIPMFYGANNFVFKPYVMDHGEGTRGQSNWFEPQNTWLNNK